MISSGLCFLLGIQCPFHGPDYHSLWATQRGADHEGGPSWANNPPEFNQAYADRVASYYGVSSANVT